MIGTSYRLPFRLLGIPVQLDISLLLILPVLAWLIGSQLRQFLEFFGMGEFAPELATGPVPFLIGFTAALGLFLSVLIHELGHSAVGRRFKVKVKRITLWILGGMAEFEKMPRQPGVEALIAIAGPVTSYSVAAGFYLLGRLFAGFGPIAEFLFAYLAFMNVVLATFNLLPALPLDGGRVFRSLLALRMSFLRATEIATSVSKALAFMLGILGFLSMNIFWILIAFFVYLAVSSEWRQAAVTEMLRGVRVEDLMTRRVKTVSPDLRLSGLVQKVMALRHLGYPVVDEAGSLLGLVTLEDVQRHRLREAHPGDPTVRDLLSGPPPTIPVNATALEAFDKMARQNYQRLIVLEGDGSMAGILSKTDLIRALQVKAVGLEVARGSDTVHSEEQP